MAAQPPHQQSNETFHYSYLLEPTSTGWRAACMLDGAEVMAVQKAEFRAAAAWCEDHYRQSG